MKYTSIKVTALVAIAGLAVGTSSLKAQSDNSKESVKSGLQTMEDARMERIAQSPSLFIQTANQANLTEIQAGQIAQQKGQSQEIKDYGKELVKDHQASNEKLQQLAKDKGIECTNKLDMRHQMKIDRLTAYSGEEFDKRFLEDQTKAHKQDVALFEQVAAKCPDKDVKEFAQNTLPALRQHLQMAQGTMVHEPSGSQGDSSGQKPQEQPQQPQQSPQQ